MKLAKLAKSLLEFVNPTLEPRERLNLEDVFDTIEAAVYLGLAPGTLVVYRSKGVGPNYYRVRGRVFYILPDLDAYLAQWPTPEGGLGTIERVETVNPQRGTVPAPAAPALPPPAE